MRILRPPLAQDKNEKATAPNNAMSTMVTPTISSPVQDAVNALSEIHAELSHMSGCHCLLVGARRSLGGVNGTRIVSCVVVRCSWVGGTIIPQIVIRDKGNQTASAATPSDHRRQARFGSLARRLQFLLKLTTNSVAPDPNCLVWCSCHSDRKRLRRGIRKSVYYVASSPSSS